MLQQETDESEDLSVEFETPTDDEEITIPSQDKNREVHDIPDSDIRDEQTLSNTATRRLATTYGAPAWGSPATDRYGAPSSDRQSTTQGCSGKYHCQESESDFPVVGRTADFD